MTTLQKTIIGATLAVAVGTGIYQAREASNARAEVETLRQQQAPLAENVRQLQGERDDATNRLAGVLAENTRLIANPERNELLKLRGEVGRLRTQTNSPSPATSKTLDTRDPLWEPNWIALRPFDLSQFPDSGTKISRAEAKDVGTATPAALLQTWIWAQRESDPAGMLKTWDFPEGTTEQEKLSRLQEALRDQEYARQNPDRIGHAHEIKLRDLYSLGDDYYLAFIDYTGWTTGTHVGHQIFRRVGDEWRSSIRRVKK